jgi:hypothetical protein
MKDYINERYKLEKQEKKNIDYEDLIGTKKELVCICRWCKRRIYDGDTYCLITHIKLHTEYKICFNCGMRYSQNENYEVITLEA